MGLTAMETVLQMLWYLQVEIVPYLPMMFGSPEMEEVSFVVPKVLSRSIT
jgi:hypothetical protein